MAAKLPVISTLDGGQKELARDGENMWVYQAADPTSLAGAIDKLLAMPDSGQQMAEMGRKEVETLYDMPVIAKRIENFLIQVKASP